MEVYFILSNFKVLSKVLICALLSLAYALAVIPELLENVTVGVDVYPVPWFVTIMLVTTPTAITAVAVAPVPPPPLIVITGGTV